MIFKNQGDLEWIVPEFDIAFWLGKRQKYCVVIPVINEGKRISSLLSKMHSQSVANSADIIIVDGGSSDGSLESCKMQVLGVQCVLVKRGPGGLSAQLRCAYAFALQHGYDGIITIDGNDKDDPAAIPQFLNALINGIDFAQASRFISGGVAKNTPVIRDLAIRLIHAPLLSLFSGFHWSDTTQGFRAYSRKMLLDARISPFREVFSSYELLAYLSYRVPKLGFRCVEIPSKRTYPVDEVPTKIKGIVGYIKLIQILFKACFGLYNPSTKK